MAVLSSNPVLPTSLQSWNKIIKKQELEGCHEKAILSFIHMQELGHFADNFTYPILLKAAANLSLDKLGLALHGQIIKNVFCNHSFVQTALVNLYSSFGCSKDAYRVFQQIATKDIIVWNSMLDAYAAAGQMEDATTRKFFNQMPSRNIITWNTMLAGYLGRNCFDSAIALFEEMKEKEYNPDYLTITNVLSACASLGLLEKGEEVHIFALEKGLTSSAHVTTALIEMYAKCGRILSSLQVFYKSQVMDIYGWNAMISGLALHGQASAAFKLFDDMKGKGLRPDDITFIGLLSACSHSGLVHKGLELFSSMEKKCAVNPKLEHYGCIVDLLGRAGFLCHAFQLIESMPFEPGKSIVGALLGACVIYRDTEIGEKVVKLLLKRNGSLTDGEYMMVANLYASCKNLEEANRWMNMMNASGITKTAGCSIIQVNGEMYRFVAGDKSNLINSNAI
ncbi:unnamed protein product [Coffea canephora]|uniref:Pentacotripeptide-repeat region of PRORP domain-containing protein n=1 Tax=Coffea canephora TaxID=49390 RepID=A0A068UH23_COFCA|nr:unnamed protein product [Coffea canephora]